MNYQVMPHNVLSRPEWADKINGDWRATRDSILAVGAALIEAKAQLPHGEFEAMVKDDLPFSPSTARMLRIIASDARIANRQFTNALPSSWYTLYELTTLGDADFQTAIKNGTICPDMGQKEVRALKAEIARTARLDTLADISKGNTELDTTTRYPVIYADPPWRYENPPMGGTNRSIENHYPTMTLEEICAMPVSDLATDDAMLYMWATAPKLVECLEVVKAWGFEYRTNLVWDKEKIGMGYHARNQHEILLVCKRGTIPPPLAGTQPSSVLREPRGKHSAKPHFYYDMIEAAYPQLPKIELFCRTPRDGWDAWGNQAEVAA